MSLRAGLGGDPVTATGVLADGSTLIAFSEVYPGKRFAVLQSLTTACASNLAFGTKGLARIAISSQLAPGHPAALGSPPGGLWVNVVAARIGGGAIVAGTYEGEWAVGEVSPSGRLDPSFGKDGWTVLPYRGEVSAVVQEAAGRILLGGDNGGGGCCTLTWAAALSVHGQLDRSFGRRGRTPLPTGEDPGVASLMLEPNGDILAKVGYGNMGCWGIELTMLTPSGGRVPLFDERLARFWQQLGFGAFVGDVYVDDPGFTLVGTGQGPCAGGPRFSAPSATGVLTRFRRDGRSGRVSRFPSPLSGEIDALRIGDDTVFVASPYANVTQLTLTALRRDGTVDQRFGDHGHAHIRTPWRGTTAANYAIVSVLKANPNSFLIIARRYGHRDLQLIRVRL